MVEATRAEKMRILHDLDIDAALAVSPYHPPGGYKDNGQYADTREVALAGLHRARLRQPKEFSGAELMASRLWLYNNGWKNPLKMETKG